VSPSSKAAHLCKKTLKVFTVVIMMRDHLHALGLYLRGFYFDVEVLASVCFFRSFSLRKTSPSPSNVGLLKLVGEFCQ
jgi:hypothetical protein